MQAPRGSQKTEQETNFNGIKALAFEIPKSAKSKAKGRQKNQSYPQGKQNKQ